MLKRIVTIMAVALVAAGATPAAAVEDSRANATQTVEDLIWPAPGIVAPPGFPELNVLPGLPIPQGTVNTGLEALAHVGRAQGHIETPIRGDADLESLTQGRRIALDDASPVPNSFVAGLALDVVTFDFDGMIVKFDGNGQRVYATRVDAGPFDLLFGVDVDGDGNAYAGGSASIDGRGHFLAVKVDPDGALLWQRIVPLPTGVDFVNGYDAVLDPSGNLVLAGIAGIDVGAGDAQAAVAKLDPDGNVLFSRSYGSSEAQEYMEGVDVDTAGNIYVSGNVRGQVHVLKLNADGDVVAAATASGVGYASGTGIAVAPDGTVYVAGYRSLLDGSSFSVRPHLTRFTGDLEHEWTRVYIVSPYAQASDVDVDDAGNVVFGGLSISWVTTPNIDTFIVKVTPDGVTLWTRLVESVELASAFNPGWGVATTGDGLLVATSGSIRGDGGFNDQELSVAIGLGVSGVGPGAGALNTVVHAAGGP